MPRVEIVQKHNTAARRLYIRGHNGKVSGGYRKKNFKLGKRNQCIGSRAKQNNFILNFKLLNKRAVFIKLMVIGQ